MRTIIRDCRVDLLSLMLSSFPAPTIALIQGSSRGIGLALTEALLNSGRLERVIACARHPEQSAGLAALAEQHGARLELRTLDITRVDQMVALAAALKAAGLRPHLVINVAGVLHGENGLAPEKRLEDLDFDQMQRIFAVNAIGPAMLSRHLLPLMASEGKAVFAALSARVGSIGDNRLGGWYAYRASKSALNQLLRTASIEARRRFKNVVIAALHPGTTDTDLSRPFQANVPEEKLFSPQFVAARLLQVIDGLQLDDSGGFFAWDGQPIPW
ncbi:MAG: SDR family NAD(P)-dependent oxidoreductase [Wenzhouxiangella sp.]